MGDKPFTLFYSWQSWTNRARNMNFIEAALEQVREELETEEGLIIQIDRDTKDVPGIPPIADTILKKINECDVFLADMTYVGKANENGEERPIPNPNVLFELGYAVKALTHDRIILVMNTAFGPADYLPFDFNHLRHPIQYSLNSGQEKNPVLINFVKSLKFAIKMILTKGLPSKQSASDMIGTFISRGDDISLERVIHQQIEQVYQKISSPAFYEKRQALTQPPQRNIQAIWSTRFELYARLCEPELTALAALCWHGETKHMRYISEALQRWMEREYTDPSPNLRYIPSLFLVYITGIVAVHKERWHWLSSSLLTALRARQQPDRIQSSFEIMMNTLVIEYQQDLRLAPDELAGIGKWIEAYLRSWFKPYILSDQQFFKAFDVLEFILAVYHFSTRSDDPYSSKCFQRHRGPLLFVEREVDGITAFLQKGQRAGPNWDFLNTSLFDGRKDKFARALETYYQWIVSGLIDPKPLNYPHVFKEGTTPNR